MNQATSATCNIMACADLATFPKNFQSPTASASSRSTCLEYPTRNGSDFCMVVRLPMTTICIKH